MSGYDLVIAGAGSVGLPLAYYCAKKGLKVLVVDKEPSWGRGQNRAAIGGIRATFSDPAKISICTESLAIASSFEEEHGLDIEWRKGGYLFVAYDEEREAAFRDLLGRHRAAGLDISWIGPDRVAELAPGINEEGLRGGTFSPGDGYASPLKASVAFHKLALEAGAEFRFGEEVTGVDVGSAGTVTTLASGKQIPAETVMYSAGRQGQTAHLDLANAGLEADNRGRIFVDDKTFQTKVDHIYAVGDVIRFPALAATSMEQGRLSAYHAFGEPTAGMTALQPIGI